MNTEDDPVENGLIFRDQAVDGGIFVVDRGSGEKVEVADGG